MIKYLRYGLEMGWLWGSGLIKFRHYANKKNSIPLKKRTDYLDWFAQKANKHGFHAKFFISKEGEVPGGQAILACNHRSAIDPVMVLTFDRRPMGFLSKKENETTIAIGNILKSVETGFIDRSDIRSEIKIFRELSQTMKKYPELSYCTFPEGTRSMPPDYPLGEFHPGMFNLAIRNNLPIIPIVLYGTERVTNAHYHYHCYPIQVRYLKPILPEEYAEMTTREISDLISNRMKPVLEEFAAKDRELVKTCNHYSDKKTDKVLRVKLKAKKF